MDAPEEKLPEEPQGARIDEAPQPEVTPAEVPARELPEDLRVPWTWLDLFIFIFFGLGAAIVLRGVAGTLLFVLFALSPQEIQKLATAKTLFVTLHQLLWSATMLLFLYLVVRVRVTGPFWPTIGWRALRTQKVSRAQAYTLCLLGGMVLGLVMQFASLLVRAKAKLPIEQYFQNRPSVLLMMLMAVFVAPLIEETIFRGYLYPMFARSFGVAAGVVVTGVLFGLMHALQLWGGWGQIALLILVGIVFTYVRARTGTVVTSYLLHLGYNSILFIAFFILTGGLRHFPKVS